jgi:hypothetical protein
MHRILVLTFLFAAALAPAAHAVPYGNVVPITLPAPKGDEVVLARVQIGMEISRKVRPSPASIGPLTVRRAGRAPARGYAVNAVRARVRGKQVTVRLVAVRTGNRSLRRLRLKLRIGTARAAFTGARTRTVAMNPDARVRRLPECGVIGGEAMRWRPVAGLAGVRIGGERFGARTTVGAAQQIACRRAIRSVPSAAAERFLVAVHPAFAGGPGSPVEGFFATWARGEDGGTRICVFVRGDAGATGDVTVGTTTQPFTLDDDRGVARTQTDVPGEGEYLFTVRWRQSDGTFRETESTLRVPAGGTRGDNPPAPYSAAGACA